MCFWRGSDSNGACANTANVCLYDSSCLTCFGTEKISVPGIPVASECCGGGPLSCIACVLQKRSQARSCANALPPGAFIPSTGS